MATNEVESSRKSAHARRRLFCPSIAISRIHRTRLCAAAKGRPSPVSFYMQSAAILPSALQTGRAQAHMAMMMRSLCSGLSDGLPDWKLPPTPAWRLYSACRRLLPCCLCLACNTALPFLSPLWMQLHLQPSKKAAQILQRQAAAARGSSAGDQPPVGKASSGS